MPITDLTGYTWVGNSIIEYVSNFSYNITYKAYYNSGADYDTGISLYSTTGDIGFTYYAIGGGDLTSFGNVVNSEFIYFGGTKMQATTINNTLEYIEFTGGTDATNSTLIAWLEANGTLTAPQPPAQTDKIFIGNSALSKAFLGNSELSSIWLGNVKLYEVSP